jgi:assimilatory nitrate reductase catalytic subunit
MTAIRTTCPYCGIGCGIRAQLTSGGVEIRGDPQHPANRGALCSKGSALGETLGIAHRLLAPRMHGRETDWETALDAVAQGFRRVIDEHGPEAVAFYVSGQLLTEDYYVANKLMKGFIGSGNIDTNSRLCMSSAVAAHQRAFGEDLVPVGYEDLELADLVVLVGSNLAWCHPVLFRRLLQEKERRPGLRLVVIDPRRTPTCDAGDLHLPLRAGTDVTLLNGLLSYLHRHGHADAAFVETHTQGAAAALLAADRTAGDVKGVAHRCGLDPELLERFYEWFGATARVVTVFSQGVNQSDCGTDKANAIINAHLLTGRIGSPGQGPFSITGQPNAMGGREVGGLATALAAHLHLGDPAHRALVRRFWNAPRLAERPGLKAVELFDAIHDGRVRAVWIMGTNPVVSLPDADRARAALEGCELVVVSDCVADTDTAALAHVLLPAAAWGEKDGTVTNSERCISRQRAFLPLPGGARPDWWIICEVARRLGYTEHFAYSSAAQIFDEHARLSAHDNDGARAFNLAGLAGLGTAGYDGLEPTRWPAANMQPGEAARLLGDGRFFHADGRARLIALEPREPTYSCDEEYPLVLNTGRIRDQWHTMTRTGRSPRLSAHLPEPYVDMHAADALRFGLKEQELARVATRWGRMVVRLRTSGEMARGSIFVPIHWSSPWASDARVGALVNPVVDPVSGEPAFKQTPARVEPFVVDWYGVLLSRHPLPVQTIDWWVQAEGGAYRRYELAGRSVPADWPSWARSLLGVAPDADFIDYEDAACRTYRAAQLDQDGIVSCLFIAAQPLRLSRTWLGHLFEQRQLSAADRLSLLAGRPREGGGAAETADGGSVCACSRVGRDAILGAIARGLRTPAAIGRETSAGTHCGSCIPELRRIIAGAALHP